MALAFIAYGVVLLRSTGAFNRAAESLPRWYRNLFFNPSGIPAGTEAFASRLRLVGAGLIAMGAVVIVLVTIVVAFHIP